MPEAGTIESSPSSAAQAGTGGDSVYAALMDCAEASADLSAFLGKALRCLARRFQSPYAELHVRHGAHVHQDHCHYSPADPGFWKKRLRGFLTEYLGDSVPRARVLQAKGGKARVALMALPVFAPERGVTGAMAFVVPVEGDAEVLAHLAMLDAASRL
ncbi:MAG: hypothetical protein D6788_10985, partial [Planctomycetota bacterium]